jgi:hypothetical protein
VILLIASYPIAFEIKDDIDRAMHTSYLEVEEKRSTV